jgi:hypothetical protein
LKNRPLSFALVASLALAAAAAADVVHVANWNMGNLPNDAGQQADVSTILGYIGSDVGALDLMALAETDTDSAADTLALFNSTFGSSYSSFLASADGGGDRTGFMYNTSSFSLVGTTEISGLTHPALRGQFRPAGTSGALDIFVYAVHLQSGDASTNEDARLAEAQLIRADADALGTGAVVLYLGDFNWSSSDGRGANPTLSAWDAFAAPGNGQGLDPANAVGDWRDNAAYLDLHTQDPGAAMDDRFDMQIASAEWFDGEGHEYLSGTYRVIGNNGTHDLDGLITTGSGAPSDVLSALAGFDHLPVVASYNLTIPEPAAVTFIAGLGLLCLSRRRGLAAASDRRLHQAGLAARDR